MVSLKGKFQKVSDQLSDSTSSALSSFTSKTSDAIEMLESTAKDNAEKVLDEASRTTSSITTATMETAGTVKSSVKKNVALVDNKLQTTLDSGDMMLSSMTTRLGDIAFSTGLGAIALGAGKFIVAPIIPGVFPIVVAMTALDLVLTYSTLHTESSKGLKRDAQKLQVRRVSKCLSRYGIVTEDAVFRTDKVEVSIDSESGVIDGKVLIGEFKGAKLSEIGIDNLNYLSSHTDTDKDTTEFINLFIRYTEENQ